MPEDVQVHMCPADGQRMQASFLLLLQGALQAGLPGLRLLLEAPGLVLDQLALMKLPPQVCMSQAEQAACFATMKLLDPEQRQHCSAQPGVCCALCALYDACEQAKLALMHPCLPLLLLRA